MNSNVSGTNQQQYAQVQNQQVQQHNSVVQTAVKPKGKKNTKNKGLVVTLTVLVLLLISALGYTGYLLYESKNMSAEEAAKVAGAYQEKEMEVILEKVGRHLLLPEDEQAELGTVLNVEALQEEYPEFYKNAKNGDKLLFYPDRAILYDLTNDIILNIAPIIDPSKFTQQEEVTVDEEESVEEVNNIDNTDEVIEDDVVEETE